MVALQHKIDYFRSCYDQQVKAEKSSGARQNEGGYFPTPLICYECGEEGHNNISARIGNTTHPDHPGAQRPPAAVRKPQGVGGTTGSVVAMQGI